MILDSDAGSVDDARKTAQASILQKESESDCPCSTHVAIRQAFENQTQADELLSNVQSDRGDIRIPVRQMFQR